MTEQEKEPKRGIELSMLEIEQTIDTLSDEELHQLVLSLDGNTIWAIREASKNEEVGARDFLMDYLSKKETQDEKEEEQVREWLNFISLRPDVLKRLGKVINRIEESGGNHG